MSETQRGGCLGAFQSVVGSLDDVAQQVVCVRHGVSPASGVVGVGGIEAVAVALPQLEHLVRGEDVVERDVGVDVLHIDGNPIEPPHQFGVVDIPAHEGVVGEECFQHTLRLEVLRLELTVFRHPCPLAPVCEVLGVRCVVVHVAHVFLRRLVAYVDIGCESLQPVAEGRHAHSAPQHNGRTCRHLLPLPEERRVVAVHTFRNAPVLSHAGGREVTATSFNKRPQLQQALQHVFSERCEGVSRFRFLHEPCHPQIVVVADEVSAAVSAVVADVAWRVALGGRSGLCLRFGIDEIDAACLVEVGLHLFARGLRMGCESETACEEKEMELHVFFFSDKFRSTFAFHCFYRRPGQRKHFCGRRKAGGLRGLSCQILHRSLCCKPGYAKKPTDTAKVAIKSEKSTPFGDFFQQRCNFGSPKK